MKPLESSSVMHRVEACNATRRAPRAGVRARRIMAKLYYASLLYNKLYDVLVSACRPQASKNFVVQVTTTETFLSHMTKVNPAIGRCL